MQIATPYEQQASKQQQQQKQNYQHAEWKCIASVSFKKKEKSRREEEKNIYA